MAKERVIPEYNEAVMCPKCGEESDVLVGLYGLIGGGIGPYTMCSNCGILVTKSFEEVEGKEIIDAEFTEVNDERSAIEKDKD